MVKLSRFLCCVDKPYQSHKFSCFFLGLIVWYHGPLPVDYIGLVARIYRDTERRVFTVTDRCLEILPGLDMFRHHMRVGSFSKVKIASLLEAGELVGVSPGGARECLFDHDCSVLWNNRLVQISIIFDFSIMKYF